MEIWGFKARSASTPQKYRGSVGSLTFSDIRKDLTSVKSSIVQDI